MKTLREILALGLGEPLLVLHCQQRLFLGVMADKVDWHYSQRLCRRLEVEPSKSNTFGWMQLVAGWLSTLYASGVVEKRTDRVCVQESH